MAKNNEMNDQLELRRIEDFIKTLGEKELRYMNRLLVERLKLIHQKKSTDQMMRFNIGERVIFKSPEGVKKSGVIIRLNKKTASIHTDDGEKWNVAPGFLEENN